MRLNPYQCSFYAGGEQCPSAATRWAWVLGRRRKVCAEHEHVQSVPEGARILWDKKVRLMQEQLQRGPDKSLEERLAGIVRRARDRDQETACEVYRAALARATAAGARDPQAVALLAVYRAGRYPEGDPRREGQ